MMNHRSLSITAAAALLTFSVSGELAAQPLPVPAVPPVPVAPAVPAPPALVEVPEFAVPPIPPLPPVPPTLDFDFNFDFADVFEFKQDAGFPFAFQAPQAVPAPPTGKPGAAAAVRVQTEEQRAAAQAERMASQAENLYRQARSLIDQNRYERAIAQLEEVARMTAANARADAALYWKAYSQARLAARADALTTLADLQKRFANSAWMDAARALEVEVRQASGQSVSPDMLADEDLKLLALRGLMQTDPDRGLPMVEQLLSGNSSVRVKENALFVLSQSRAPRARDIIAATARRGSNPDVQLTAVRYLGAMRGTDNQQLLGDIYRSTSDEAVKRAVIDALYRSQAAPKLFEIVKVEKNVQRKRSIVRYLGSLGAERSSDMLKELYRSGTSEEKRDVIGALAGQRNAAALVELARAEKDPALKRDIVSRLSTMKSKEATDYMLELLK